MTLSHAQLLDSLAVNIAQFRAAVDGSLAVPIPFLGEWTVRDLTIHLGRVFGMASTAVQEASEEFGGMDHLASPPDGDDALLAWFDDRAMSVLDTLRSADPDARAWTFAGVQTAAFWIRRQAHETLVHRWDAEAAIGPTSPIDHALAADAIDEYAAVSLRFSSSRPDRSFPAGSLHLHATDGPGEWMFATAADGSVTVTQEHGKGDAAVRGSAGDLAVWIRNRPVNPANLEVFGDAAVAAAWQAVSP